MHDADPNPPTVLVVDDDRAIRLAVSGSLTAAGFQVVESRDGAGALALFEQVRPDIVLLDILMPGMDGFEACERLRQLPLGRHTPIVMLTALDDTRSIERAYEAGATDFVTKPINYLILGHRMQYILRAKRTADELRKSEARAAAAQRIARICHWEWDAAHPSPYCSPGLAELFGRADGVPFHRVCDFLRAVHRDDRRRVCRTLRRAIRTGHDYRLEHRIARPDGAERTVYQEGKLTLDGYGAVRRVVGTVQDITERRAAEERIRYLTHYDEITGLPNRTFFSRLLRSALQTAARDARPLAVALLGFGNLKRISETLGRDLGTKVLQALTERLRRCLPADASAGEAIDPLATRHLATTRSVIARVGDDAFAVLLLDIERLEDAAGWARSLTRAVQAPFSAGAEQLHLNASIGISGFPVDGNDAELLLNQAEVAMHHAEEHLLQRAQFYTESLNERAVRRYSLETRLRRAVENAELALHYQPRVNVRSGRIMGMEALARWRHPDLGAVSPIEFVAIAEQSELIHPLSMWVLETACRQTRAWHDAGLGELTVSVNLSPALFKHDTLTASVRETVADSGLHPSFVELELTEGLLMEDTEQRVAALAALRELGIRISVDDFGTGYSSLSYLTRFPLDGLKVDQCFVSGLHSRNNGVAVIKSIIALGRSLGLKVTAEGVERYEELAFLRARECEEVQGFYFSPPLPPQEFGEWVTMHRDSPALLVSPAPPRAAHSNRGLHDHPGG